MVSFNGYIKNHQRVHSQIFTTTVVFLFIHQGLSGAPFHVGPPFKFCRNFSGLFIIFCAPFHVGSCHRTSGPMWNPRMTFSKWGTSGSSYVCFEALSMFPYPLMVKQAIKHTHTHTTSSFTCSLTSRCFTSSRSKKGVALTLFVVYDHIHGP